MRFVFILILAILISPPPAFAQNDQVEEFNAAYKTYSELIDQGRHKDAIPHAEKALALAEDLLTDDPAQIAMMTYLLAEVQFRGFAVGQSIDTAGLALERYRGVFGQKNIRVAEPLFLTADALHRLGGKDDVRRAERLLEEALRLYEDHFGEESPRVSEPLRRLAYNAVVARDGRAAEGLSRRAVRLTEDAGPEFLYDYVASLYQHGRVALARRFPSKAIDRLLKARSVLMASEMADSPFRLGIEVQLIEAYERAGKSEEATEHVRYLARIDPDKETSEPIPLFRIVPDYPFSARQMGREGKVIVSFTIDTEGRVQDAKILEAQPGRIFDSAALEAINRFRYKPRIENGEFVATPDQKIRLVWELE